LGDNRLPIFLIATASLVFSTQTQSVSPATSPGNSQIRTDDPKPLESETPSRTVSNTSDSTTIVADLTYGLGASRRAQKHPLCQTLFPPQHDPIIDDTPHVDLTEIPTQGAPSPPPRSEPFGIKPRLQITTSAPLERRNSDSPGTEFYTPGGIGEVVDRGPFDSAMPIRVIYSRSGISSGNLAGRSGRVVGVHQQRNPMPMYKFPAQLAPVTPNDSKATEAPPRHGLKMSLPRPPKINDGSPSRISGATFTAIPDHEVRTRLAARDERGDVGTSKEATIFPRRNGKRVMPVWDGGEGKEGDDYSLRSASTDYVSVLSGGEEHPQDNISRPVSTTGCAIYNP
jgi:hypothetical protein